MPKYAVSDWSRACGVSERRGDIRVELADFHVAEQMGFALSGDGEHDCVRIQKTGANTAWVAQQLANFAGVSERDVGYAGRKDRHAVTEQWFSVRRPADSNVDWQRFEAAGVVVMECGRHRRKLRPGTHAGNRFRIVVRNLAPRLPIDPQQMARIRDSGVPNYFGEQRFGRGGSNIDKAIKLFTGGKLSRRQRGLAISSARSLMFNRILDLRVADGSWDTLRRGDCAVLHGSNSFFSVTEIDAVLETRCREADVHPSGALWGHGDPQSAASVAALERSVAERYPVLRDGLDATAQQSRRALRATIDDFEWHQDADRLTLSFMLGRGSYATAVLREIVNYRDCRRASVCT